MEILVTAAIIGYIIYLRYYADLRTKSEQDFDKLQVGIKLYTNGQFNEALAFFTNYLQKEPKSSVAYLYLARCYRSLGDISAAIDALRTGESYDDTVADLHLEMGQILYGQHDDKSAFLEFDKAVFHSKGTLADAFQWRGQARQNLQQPIESQQDLERANTLRQTAAADSRQGSSQRPFFDREFITHTLLILVNSAILLVIIKKTTVIHLPYLLAAIAAAVIGFIEPRKGWSLAILQASAIWIGYTFFTTLPQTSGDRELELFGLYGSIILTFVGSFIGGILKRQLIRQ